MSKKSFDQKASAYWGVIRHNPSISSNAIGRRYKDTAFGMRKSDRDSLVRELKDAVEFNKRMANSNAEQSTKKRLKKETYQAAKRTSAYGRRKYPPKHLDEKLRQMIIKTFKLFREDEYTEFYEEES